MLTSSSKDYPCVNLRRKRCFGLIECVVIFAWLTISCLGQPVRPPNEQQFSDVLESIFEMVREVTRSIASLVRDVTDALGINTDDGGIGGVVGGALNLLSVGADIATGVASHVIGGGDLFGGLIPVIG